MYCSYQQAICLWSSTFYDDIYKMTISHIRTSPGWNEMAPYTFVFSSVLSVFERPNFLSILLSS